MNFYYHGQLATEEYKRDFTRKSWGGVVQIAQNHNYLITGDRNYYWIDYMRDKYFKKNKAGRVLSLGCGEGFVERLFKEREIQFDSITGVDLSQKCITVAEQRAKENKLALEINYFSANLNDYIPPANSFDFIFFFHSLHHVEALERLLSGCARAIAQNGILMLNEFVGPSRFQWTQEQLDEANRLFKTLPENLRVDLSTQKIKTEIKRMTINEMIKHDESEAVRSADIEYILKQYFDIIEEKNWGGTLNHLIFENIAGNFDVNNSYHNGIVELLIHHENTLIAHNILPSDFKFYMAIPKKK